MGRRCRGGRTSLLVLWVVAALAVLPTVVRAEPAGAASAPAGLPPADQCAVEGTNGEYCLTDENTGGAYTSTGHLGDGGEVTLTISPSVPPCGNQEQSGCLRSVSWTQSPRRCLQHRYDGTGWFQGSCAGTDQFENTEDRYNPFITPNFLTSTARCGGTFNSTYGNGGPPGDPWSGRASQHYTCTARLVDANRFVEMRGETWALFEVSYGVSTPENFWCCDGRQFRIPVRLSGARVLKPDFEVAYERPPSLTAHFTNETEGEPGHAFEYLWTFGDGEQSTETSPSHTYSDPGTYWVSLQVHDPYGVTKSVVRQVRVPNELRVTCSATQSGPGGSQLAFSADLTAGEGAPQYEWTFGDGTTASAPTAQRTADEPGTFGASLTVTDGDEVASDTCDAEVEGPELQVEVTFPDGSDEGELALGETMSIEVTVRAGTEGLGSLSDVRFVGDPLVVDPSSKASVTSGPTPSVPAGLDLDAGESSRFAFELHGDQLGWFDLYSTATAFDDAGGSVGPAEGYAVLGIVAPAPLDVTLATDPAERALPGQEVAVTLDVRNTSDESVSLVRPKLDVDWEPEEPSDDPVVTGPLPTQVRELESGATTRFEYTVVAATAGELSFTARAKGFGWFTGDPVTSDKDEATVEVAGGDLVVNSTADTDDDDAGDELCDTGGTVVIDGDEVPECTLRAAISEANAGDLDEITFDIDGTPVINPSVPLPEVVGPATIDGTTQAEGMVQLSGGSLGDDVVGLSLGGTEVTVLGMSITGFDGAAVDMAGEGFHVVEQSSIGVAADGAPGGNGAGIRVTSPDNRIGGEGDAGNVIANNSPAEAPEAPEKGAGAEAVKEKVTDIPANIVVLDGGGALVSGNELDVGLAVVAAGALDSGGVQVTDNEIKGAVASAALPTAGAVTMSGNDVSTQIGVVAATGSGATVAVDDNDFDQPKFGALLIGAGTMQVTNNRVTSGGIGVISALGSEGTRVEGNAFTPTDAGILVIGTSHAAFTGNRIEGKAGILAIGGSSTLTGGNTYADNVISSEIGMMLLAEDSSQITGNTLTSEAFGFFLGRMQASTIADNTIEGAAVGMILINVGGADISGNSITGGKLGALLARTEPTENEKSLGGVGDEPTGSSDLFEKIFNDESSRIGLDWANASQQIAEFDESVIYDTPVNAALNTWTGNDISGNLAGMILGGDVEANMIGGTGPGAANRISGNRTLGLLVTGDPGPQEITIRRNAIFGNGTGAQDQVPAGVPDIRFGSPTMSGAQLTAAVPNDAGDGDDGPNGLQNHPLITGVAADGSSVSGELWSTPDASFLVDLYATSACHGSGHGGGERYLGEVAVRTGATGRGTFTAPVSLGAGELVTATATTTGGFVDGATSEFSRCAALGLVATGMTEPAEAGDTKIEVGDNDEFEVGDDIVINPGGTNEETASVGGFGSLILTEPLQQDHQPGELIVVVARAAGPGTPPPPGPALPPTPAPAPAPVVQPPRLPPGGTTTGGGGAAEALTVLGGEDRIATAIQLSRDSFADDAATSLSPLRAAAIDSPLPAGAAVLTGAADFADGLVAAALAVEEVAPVLLTGRGARLDPRVLAEIDRILAPGDRVFVVGGTAAVGPAVVQHLEAAGYDVIRVAGVDRYATSVAVARRLGPPDIILETTGLDFADALAAGAAAHVEGGVVLLTAGASIPAVVAEYLAELAGVPRYAVGGPASVADPTATMVAGADRYATAAAVARRFFDKPAAIGIASGESFADALAGAAHAALRGGPLVLVRHGELPAATDAYLRENAAAITEVFIYGGTAAISREVREAAAAVA